jgi:hypothetical protein
MESNAQKAHANTARWDESLEEDKAAPGMRDAFHAK